MNIKESFQRVGGLEPAAGDSFIPLSEAELVETERKLGCMLPAELRMFLNAFGASSCGEYVNFDPIEKLPSELSTDGTGHFSHFFGGNDGECGTTLTLMFNIDVYRERMPTTLIPIGSNGGGNLICYGISGDETGNVYYWDHENEWDEEDYIDSGEPVPDGLAFQNVYLVARGLEDFANRLFVVRHGDS